MIEYIDNIPLKEHKNYKYIIWQVTEHICRGFKDDDEILGYYASKSDATLFVYRLSDCQRREIFISSIGVK